MTTSSPAIYHYESKDYVAKLTSRLYETHLNSDVDLKVFDEPMNENSEREPLIVHAHRTILSAASRPFDVMLNPRGSFSESRRDVVEIHGVRQEAFVAVVRFVYTGRVTVSARDAPALYQAADMYDVDELRDCATRALRASLVDASQIDFDELNALVRLAERYRAEPLHDVAIETISRFADDLFRARLHRSWSKSTWARLLTLDDISAQEFDTLQALIDWAEQFDDVRDELRGLIESIRFGDVPASQLEFIVEFKYVEAEVLVRELLSAASGTSRRQRGLVRYRGVDTGVVTSLWNRGETFRQGRVPFEVNRKTFWEVEILVLDMSRGAGFDRRECSVALGVGIDRECFYSDQYYFDNRGLFWRFNGDVEDNMCGNPYMDSKDSKRSYRSGSCVGFMIDLATPRLYCFLNRKLVHVVPLKEKRGDYVPIMYVKKGAIRLLPPSKEPLYLDLNNVDT